MMGNVRADLGLRIEDQSPVQSISHPLHQLLPDTVLQKLLRIHLKHHSRYNSNTILFFLELHWYNNNTKRWNLSIFATTKAEDALSHYYLNDPNQGRLHHQNPLSENGDVMGEFSYLRSH